MPAVGYRGQTTEQPHLGDDVLNAPDVIAVHIGGSRAFVGYHAGFVEVGESLEDAVRREVTEETGVRVGEVSYVASQAWPFPSGLMIGFHATAITEDITVDGEELLEAHWFTRSELRQYAAANPLGRPDSIDRLMLRAWLGGGDDLEQEADSANT